MTAYSDGTATYAALAKAPDDPAIRAALYDWWQEFDPVRWEFVCVQTELEDAPPHCAYECRSRQDYRCKWCQLRDRESALLAAHRAEWLCASCSNCGGYGQTPKEKGKGGYTSQGVMYRCLACSGTGDAGGLTWHMGSRGTERPHVTFRRGLPSRVECPRMSDAVERVAQDSPLRLNDPMGYTTPQPLYRPSPWLRAVTKHHPVEEVVPLDRLPVEYCGGCGAWRWCMGRTDENASTLPSPIYERVVLRANKGERYFATRAAAVDALAIELAAFGRG